MDQGAWVSEQINDGKGFLERLAEEGVPVTAAAWVKESENGRWYLYLATPLVPEDGGKRPAYRRINTVFRQMPQPSPDGTLSDQGHRPILLPSQGDHWPVPALCRQRAYSVRR
jgi:hypothetical protein